MDTQTEKPTLTLDEASLQDRREMVTLATGFHDLQIVSFGSQIEHDQTQTLYICPICYCLPRAPALAAPNCQCPHTFCSRCIALLIKHANQASNTHLGTRFGVGMMALATCPLCLQKRIGVQRIHRWMNWQPRLKADWEKIQVRCVWPECGKVGGAMSIAQHEIKCAHGWMVMKPAEAAAAADGDQPAQKKQALE